MRSGTYVTFGAIRCFDPGRLPPYPPIQLDGALATALSRADRALARLDGATLTLPDPDLFVYAFMRQEAVLSSQIEGTQASLDDLLEFESGSSLAGRDVGEIVNYLDAMRWGLEEIARRPVSLGLVRDMHARLLKDGRGSERAPGDLRRNQNWIGPPGCTIAEASFVPPAVPLMERALGELESFIHAEAPLPPLIRFGLVHAQFETIHPFWDGNGRIGRMLIPLLLCSEAILARPVIYPSLYFKQHRQAYYARLQATRDQADWEGWLQFFLQAIEATSTSALHTAIQINALRSDLSARAPSLSRSNRAHLLLETLFRHPYATVNQLAQRLGVTFPTANALAADLLRHDVLVEVTGGRRDRIFAFKPYLEILHDAVDDLTDVVGGRDQLAKGDSP